MKPIFFVMLLALTTTSCSRDTHNHPSGITGKQLFEVHCAECHSSGGLGSILLGVPSNKDSKLLGVQIRNKLLHGVAKGSKMPVFKTMPEKEAIQIVQYLQTLK